MTCLITAGIWESCIQTGLIPANTHYQTFFERSPLAVQIVDKEGNIRYTSTNAAPLDGETFLRLTEQKSLQQDENTLLNASPISGGFALWKEDISRIGRLLGQLREIGQELRENTGILKKEVEIKARETRVRERIRLYNLLSMQIKAQLKQIREALAAFPQADDALRRRLLLEAGVLGAYIKRRCNLSLMAEGNETITGDELGHCLTESAENIRLLGAECAVVIRTGKEPGNLYMMLCYDLLQAVIEAELNSLRKVLVNLSERKNGVTFTVQVQSGGDPAALPWSDWRAEEKAALGARLSWEQTEDGVFSIALRIQEGGGRG